MHYHSRQTAVRVTTCDETATSAASGYIVDRDLCTCDFLSHLLLLPAVIESGRLMVIAELNPEPGELAEVRLRRTLEDH